MILSLMRLKGQINRSRAITDRIQSTVEQQLHEEKTIDRKFKQSVEVADLVLNTCQNERNLVTSYIQAGLVEARKSLASRGTNACINSSRNGKEEIPGIARCISSVSAKTTRAKN